MDYTANYQLPVWAETDRILMDDFNDMTETIDQALAGKVGTMEHIQTVTATRNASVLEIDLTDFDWSGWNILFFQFRCNGDSYSNTLQMHLSGAGIGNLAELTRRGNMLGILFPGRNAAGQVCAVGFPGGQLGISTSTFSQVEKMQISITTSHMDGRETLALYGIR